MASIDKPPERNKSWRVRYRDPSGRQRTKSFRHKVDAERFAATVELDKERQAWIDPRRGKVTVGAFAEQWMATLVGLRPTTMDRRRILLRVHVLPAFGAVPLDRVTQQAVQRWVPELSSRLSASWTRQAYRSCASSCRPRSSGSTWRAIRARALRSPACPTTSGPS